MKFNWGHGIFLVIVIGISGLALMVILSTSSKVDLVTEEYYPKELKYENEIQKIINSNNLIKNIHVNISDSVYIKFPVPDYTTSKPNKINGEVLFYRPSDKYKDIYSKIHLDDNWQMSFPISVFEPGKYELIIDWEFDSKQYLFKQVLIF